MNLFKKLFQNASEHFFSKRISRKNIYSNELLGFNLDEVLFPSGKIINEYLVFDFKSGSVVVLMLNKKNEICFIKSP